MLTIRALLLCILLPFVFSRGAPSPNSAKFKMNAGGEGDREGEGDEGHARSRAAPASQQSPAIPIIFVGSGGSRGGNPSSGNSGNNWSVGTNNPPLAASSPKAQAPPDTAIETQKKSGNDSQNPQMQPVMASPTAKPDSGQLSDKPAQNESGIVVTVVAVGFGVSFLVVGLYIAVQRRIDGVQQAAKEVENAFSKKISFESDAEVVAIMVESATTTDGTVLEYPVVPMSPPEVRQLNISSFGKSQEGKLNLPTGIGAQPSDNAGHVLAITLQQIEAVCVRTSEPVCKCNAVPLSNVVDINALAGLVNTPSCPVHSQPAPYSQRFSAYMQGMDISNMQLFRKD